MERGGPKSAAFCWRRFSIAFLVSSDTRMLCNAMTTSRTSSMLSVNMPDAYATPQVMHNCLITAQHRRAFSLSSCRRWKRGLPESARGSRRSNGIPTVLSEESDRFCPLKIIFLNSKKLYKC